MESVWAAEVEPRRATETEDFLEASFAIRNRDGHRGLRQIDVHLSVRRAGEADGAGDGEDAGGADRHRRIGIDFARFIESGGELLDFGGRVEPDADRGLLAGLVDEAIAIVVLAVLMDRHRGERIRWQDDGFVDGLPGTV